MFRSQITVYDVTLLCIPSAPDSRPYLTAQYHIPLMRVPFQPIKMTGSWMYRTASLKEATLHKADIWRQILGKNN